MTFFALLGFWFLNDQVIKFNDKRKGRKKDFPGQLWLSAKQLRKGEKNFLEIKILCKKKRISCEKQRKKRKKLKMNLFGIILIVGE